MKEIIELFESLPTGLKEQCYTISVRPYGLTLQGKVTNLELLREVRDYFGDDLPVSLNTIGHINYSKGKIDLVLTT